MSAAAEMFSPHVNYLPLETERVAILKWFSAIPYQGHHDLSSEGRVESTGQWLFQRKEFKNWQQSEKSEILWLHGIRKLLPTSAPTILRVPTYMCACLAGSGKTKLV